MIRTISKICSSTNSQGPQEGIDHLFLLPERVLGMDGVQLRKDLAALDFKVQLLQSAPSGNVWLSGGENGHRINGQLPNDSQNSDSPATGKSANYQKTKDGRSQQQIDRSERLKLIKEKQNEEQQKKLEELKQQALAAQRFRERSEEERRRRIESLRSREMDKRQQVEERKRIIMEAERDRMEAILKRNQEREARMESKRKMERSSMVFAFGSSTPRMLEPTDSGSTYWASRRATSTTNVMCMSVACPGPLTRRSSERELTNNNKKRATSAGGLIDRKNVDDCRPRDSICDALYWDSLNCEMSRSFNMTVHNPSIRSNTNRVFFGEGKENNVMDVGTTLSAQRSAARRKTDLMPTVPASRDTAIVAAASRNSSVCSPARRSPGRAFSMTRLDQLSQPRATRKVVGFGSAIAETDANAVQADAVQQKGLGQADGDVSKSMTHLTTTTTSVAAGGEKSLKRSTASSRSMVHLGPPRMTRAERLRRLSRETHATSAAAPTTSAKQQATSPSGSRSGETTPRPPSALSQHSGSSSVVPSTVRLRPATAPVRKPRPNSIAGIGMTCSTDALKSGHGGKTLPCENRTTVPKVNVTKKSTPRIDAGRKADKQKSPRSPLSSTTPKDSPLQSPTVELSTENSFSASESGDRSQMATSMTTSTSKVTDFGKGVSGASSNEKLATNSTTADQKSDCSAFSDNDLTECDMTGSMTSSQIKRITTEGEAKAALAERRRLAREQAEREAELEQQRLEAERRAEEERLQREEEEQRRMEIEQLRLLEESKKAEEERLQQAIEEAKKHEEEERLRKEEEQRLKLEKEEADKKAKEEAERQRQELELKLKKEEEERLQRKKRVEAIMSRTRKGGTPAATPTKENSDDIEENGENNKVISDSNINNRKNDNDNHFTVLQPISNDNEADTLNHKQNGVHCAVDTHHVSNDLLNMDDFDVINTNIMSEPAVSPQILDLQVGKDNYNSNKQDLTDLLS